MNRSLISIGKISGNLTCVLLAGLFVFGIYSTLGAQESGDPACNDQLPETRTCSVGRECDPELRADGTCGNFVVNLNNTYGICTGADDGDHCQNARNNIICGRKRRCTKTRKQQVVEEYFCENFGVNNGTVKKHVTIENPNCVDEDEDEQGDT